MASTKKEGVATFDKVAEDEPVFILRAQDVLAPEIVREWVFRARINGVAQDKVDDARRIADAMEDWQVENHRKMPD